MSWTTFADVLFALGALGAGILLVYGGWLCVGEGVPELRPAQKPEPVPLGEEAAHPQTSEKGLAATLMGVLVPGLLLFAGGSGAAMGREGYFERGVEAYQHSRYGEALEYFRLAADGGHGRAQEILGFMYLHGGSLYGPRVPHDRARAMHWFGRAASGGREVSQHMLCVLDGRAADTVIDRGACGRDSAALGAPGPDGMARAAAGVSSRAKR